MGKSKFPEKLFPRRGDLDERERKKKRKREEEEEEEERAVEQRFGVLLVDRH